MNREEIIQYAKEMAKVSQKILETQDLMPMGFFIYEGKTVGVGMPWNNAEEKRKIISAIHGTIRKTGAIAFIFISDTWVTIGSASESIDELLHKRDMGIIKRKESVLVSIVGKNMIPHLVYFPYERKSGKIIWGETQEADANYESWMIPEEWRQPIAKGQA